MTRSTRAQRRNIPSLPLNEAIRQVTEKTDKQFHQDVAALGCLPPTFEPRATEHIAEMRSLIDRLVSSGNAYVAEDNVLFSVPSMPDYGQLSKRPLDEMIAGARVEVAAYKKDPRDFVLWKPSKPGEPAWPSPAGIKTPGRPGWHIECSAMSWKYLGEIFDIHGGGIDLVFPHHEDEIAQSRCAFHTPVMANYWMHNGFLQVEGEKMAKSAGNFVTIYELLHTNKFGSNHWHGYVLRLAMLMTHYRQPIDWTIDRLVEARQMLKEWIDCAIGFEQYPAPVPDELLSALSDDLNSPAAVAVISQLFRETRRRTNPEASIKLASALQWLGIWNGEKTNDIYGYGIRVGDGPSDWDIQHIVEERTAARARKDWKESDRIRDELAKHGVMLKDSKDPQTGELVTIWERVP